MEVQLNQYAKFENVKHRTSKSVVMRTREDPVLNSLMMQSLVFWSMSPCIADTVKVFSLRCLVKSSTRRLVLQKMTAWVMEIASYRSHKVSYFHA